MPVISCRSPMSRKAAASVVSTGSTTTRPSGSGARYSGSREDRCAVSTTDSPRSSSARAVCDPIEPRPPVMRIAVTPRTLRGAARRPLDDGLAGQLWLGRHDMVAIWASIGVTGLGLSAISMRSAITAVS